MNGLVHKIWGTSNSNLYMVCDNGSIARFNGSSWSKMTSNTTVDLEDIYGLDENHIWATGTDRDNGQSIVLQYDGTNLLKIYDNINKPLDQYFGFSTVWAANSSSLFLAGGSRLRRLNLRTNLFSEKYETGQTYVTYCVRGTRVNDIFIVAGDGECSHFNGSSWFLYPEIKILSNGSIRLLTIFPTQDIVLIGGWKFLDYYSVPMVIRGYR